jgi:hypothetical protein
MVRPIEMRGSQLIGLSRVMRERAIARDMGETLSGKLLNSRMKRVHPRSVADGLPNGAGPGAGTKAAR